MNFQYSIFISYRRNNGDKPFIEKFKDILGSEALKVTNVEKVFFDNDSIKWGQDFDTKIYNAIVECYFFIPFYHHTYLHEENLWCAKELYRAIEVEKKLRAVATNYCFILPIIDRGSPNAFPNCIGRKNAKEIKRLRHIISNKRTNAALEEFKDHVYDIFLENVSMLNTPVNFKELCADIPDPTDEEIIRWIKEQKKIEVEEEAKNLPILKKNDF